MVGYNSLAFFKPYVKPKQNNLILLVSEPYMVLKFLKLAFYYLLFIEVLLIYNIVLVSGVQSSDSVFCRLYSIIGYYKIMCIIPYAI